LDIEMASKDIRMPSVAGMFYPASASDLSHEVKQLLSNTPNISVDEDIVALISPHAGYQYSGQTAAHGFKLLKKKSFNTVVLVSPSHREYFSGISVYDGVAYKTPLGNLQIDKALRDELINNDPIIEQSARGHRQEHAIEVQLPFLQTVLPETKILPIVMGDQRREFCFHLGDRLATVLKNKKALMVASTDLSHFHPYDTAIKLDKIIIDDIESFDIEKLMTDIENESAEACGGGPTVAVLVAAHKLGANSAKILHYCNSGDVTGDHSSVVGYLSAAISRKH
jgi:AmmeMemoRadiSam system protein B